MEEVVVSAVIFPEARLRRLAGSGGRYPWPFRDEWCTAADCLSGSISEGRDVSESGLRRPLRWEKEAGKDLFSFFFHNSI